MTFPTDAILPYAQPGKASLILKHRLEKLKNTQARLRGKIALVPDVDLDTYRFRAVVDWIEFGMQFARGVQVQLLQPILKKFFARNCHIKPVDIGPGSVFTLCRIRVQAPKNLALVYEAYRALVDAYGESGASQITGIEISVDAYPRDRSDIARGILMGAMQRTIWTDRDIWTKPNSRPRMISATASTRPEEVEKKVVTKLSPAPKSDPTGKSSIDPKKHNSPMLDATLYLGAQYDQIMTRLMDKVIDEQRPDGTRTELAEEDRRVRVEVRLEGSALDEIGLTDVASLRQMKFTNLQGRHFQFKLPTFSVRQPARKGVDLAHNQYAQRRAQTYLNAGVTALMVMDDARDRQRRKIRSRVERHLGTKGLPKHVLLEQRRAPAFVSYEALNRKVALAFLKLAKREDNACRCVGGERYEVA